MLLTITQVWSILKESTPEAQRAAVIDEVYDRSESEARDARMLLELINQRLPRGSRPLNRVEADRLKKRYNRAKRRGDLDPESDMDSNGMDGSSEAESDLNGLNERQGEREEDEMEDGDSQQGGSGSNHQSSTCPRVHR